MAVTILIGVSEGNNAYRMFRFGSPWYGPLGFAVLAVAGAALASPRSRRGENKADRAPAGATAA